MVAQPLIPVKKPDGTIVHLSLDEVKKMRKQSRKAPASAQRAPVKDDRQAAPAEPRQGFPVLEDGFSLLEENLPASSKPTPLMSYDRGDQVERIVKKLSFALVPENMNRLRTIVQLRLKEVRNDEQTRQTVMRPVGEGGLGWSKMQADELLRLCGGQPAQTAGAAVPTIRELKGAPNMPVVSEAALPSTATPFNAFVHKPTGRSPVAAAPEAPAVFKLNAGPKPKIAMHDVMTKPVGLTPIDEIQAVTLTDFRRLASDPSEAAHRLEQKFLNLKEESILLFLQATDVWRQSPLYLEYMNAVSSALAGKQKLTQALVDKNKLQMAEVKALVEMDKSL